jgi:CRP/FNR family transcriptional regulator, cyclic AMP receptor protein
MDGSTCTPAGRVAFTIREPQMAGNDATDHVRLPNLESLGDATQLADQIHAMIAQSPLFENFNLAEIRLMGHFMQVYRAEPGVEIIREGAAGDFMLLLVEGKIEVFKQDRCNAPRLIALIEPGKTLGEMSMIDGEPRFATCVAADHCLFAVLTRENLARILLEQPILGAKVLMELVLMLSQRLRQTSSKLVRLMDADKSA